MSEMLFEIHVFDENGVLLISTATIPAHGHTGPSDGGTLNAAAIASGTLDNARVNFAAPSGIGTTTPAAGYFSALRLYISSKYAAFTHAFSADHTVTIPGDADVTLVGESTSQTLANKVLSQLHLLLGGFKAIFTHSNTADRTYTLPNYDATLATIAGTETLTNKTLTTPTIGSMTNAQHNHQNAAGGGQLTTAAFSVNIIAKAFRGPAALAIRKLDNATLLASIGMAESDGALVEKTTTVSLGMATNGDWIGGTSNEAASEFVWVYIDGNGNVKLHNKAPNYPSAATGSRVATMLVNQSGWNGTTGNGLNATSVVYDNDSGEGSITAGMLALIYGSADSDYSSGRGRGSGAAASRNDVSAALITAINTGTNTLTLEAGHNIAINDNDRIAVVELGALLYRQESSVWYRFIGAMYNNGSSNLDENRLGNSAQYTLNESSDYSITGTSFADIDSTLLKFSIFCDGYGNLRMNFSDGVNATSRIYFDFAVDGITQTGDNGLTQGLPALAGGMTAHFLKLRPLPGTHYVSIQSRINSGTGTVYAGAGTGGVDHHGQFSVELTGR